MGKSLWIIFAVLFVAIEAPNAHADSLFTPTFTCTQAGGCTSLPTAPAVSFPAPTTITETWNGFVFLIPLPAPSSPTDVILWQNVWQNINSSCTTSCVGVASARIQDNFSGIVETVTLTNLPSPGILSSVFLDGGDLTFAPVAVPEPSSGALMLMGIGLVLVMRKRIAQGLPQAT